MENNNVPEIKETEISMIDDIITEVKPNKSLQIAIGVCAAAIGVNLIYHYVIAPRLKKNQKNEVALNITHTDLKEDDEEFELKDNEN